MPRVTLSCLFVWAASQAANSRNNGIFSFVHVGKIKGDLNSQLDLHQMSPPGHELSGSQGGAALPSTVRTFPHGTAQAAQLGDHPCFFRLLAARRLPGLPATEKAGGLRPASSSTTGCSPLRAQGCASSTRMPTHCPASQGNLGIPHETCWTQDSLMTPALG